MIYIAIILYFFFLIFLYFIIVRRTKHLSKRHFENTWVEFLKFGYKITRRRVIILFMILFVLVSLLFLTFINNELLQERLMHTHKKALDGSHL